MRFVTNMPAAMNRLDCQRGFTLIELIMVIVIMGVIGGMVSIFMKSPIDAYIASGRRAALTDVADTVVRRISRDIRKALPNSINTSADGKCIEFIPTKTGGRYRAEEVVVGDGSSLLFGATETTFHMLGSNNALPVDQRIMIGDVIALSNFGFDVGDAYTGGLGANTALITGVADGTETIITIPSTTFNIALASPNNRFQVIPANEKVVAFVCSGSHIYRIARTSQAHICPTVSVVATDPILANNVVNSTCNFDYGGSDLQRNALISMRIQLTDSDETVSLLHQVHVNNTP